MTELESLREAARRRPLDGSSPLDPDRIAATTAKDILERVDASADALMEHFRLSVRTLARMKTVERNLLCDALAERFAQDARLDESEWQYRAKAGEIPGA